MRHLATFLTTLLLVLTSTGAYADCDKNYQQSRQLLASVKQKSINQEKVDVDGTMSQFQEVINQMQSGNCQAQLMQLMQFIQQEQQLYPAPAGFTGQ